MAHKNHKSQLVALLLARYLTKNNDPCQQVLQWIMDTHKSVDASSVFQHINDVWREGDSIVCQPVFTTCPRMVLKSFRRTSTW